MSSGFGGRYLLSTGLIGVSLLAAGAWAADDHAASDPVAAAHERGQMSNDADVRRSETQFVIPNVTLLRDDGKPVNLPAELDDGRPLVVNFIYTSCTTICPMNSQVFEQFQGDLGAERKSVHLVSISIDPEQDTPARLTEYAHRFHAGPQWQYYTGTLAASLAAQRAFDVYRGEKMSHTPVTLMRAAPGGPWLRIEGFVTPDELMDDYQKLLASP